MTKKAIKLAVLLLALALAEPSAGVASEKKAYSFYVLNQRSVALTAQYWNPIFTYVGKKSGVPLELRMAKTAQGATPLPSAATMISSTPTTFSHRSAIGSAGR